MDSCSCTTLTMAAADELILEHDSTHDNPEITNDPNEGINTSLYGGRHPRLIHMLRCTSTSASTSMLAHALHQARIKTAQEQQWKMSVKIAPPALNASS